MNDIINQITSSIIINDTNNNNLNQFKSELLYFKDELLKDFKIIESNIEDKYTLTINELKQKLNLHENNFSIINQKFLDLTNLLSKNNEIKDSIDKLNQFKEKINEKMLNHEIRSNLIDNELHNSIIKYDKLLSDSIIYPGIIGKSCKYKNFHELIDYFLIQIGEFNSFKDKSLLDLKSYKTKLETLIQSFKIQIDNIFLTLTEFSTQKVNDCENRMKIRFDNYNDELNGIRLQNNKYIEELKNRFNSLIIDWEKVLEIKKEIYSKFDVDVEKFKIENNKLSQKLEENQSEFNLIKDRFTKLSEFIKDVRFRKNIGQEVKKYEFTQMSKKIDFDKKQIFDENKEILHKRKRSQDIIYDFGENNHILKNFKRSLSLNQEQNCNIGEQTIDKSKLLSILDSINKINEDSVKSRNENNSCRNRINYINILKNGNDKEDLNHKYEKHKSYTINIIGQEDNDNLIIDDESRISKNSNLDDMNLKNDNTIQNNKIEDNKNINNDKITINQDNNSMNKNNEKTINNYNNNDICKNNITIDNINYTILQKSNNINDNNINNNYKNEYNNNNNSNCQNNKTYDNNINNINYTNKHNNNKNKIRNSIKSYRKKAISNDKETIPNIFEKNEENTLEFGSSIGKLVNESTSSKFRINKKSSNFIQSKSCINISSKSKNNSKNKNNISKMKQAIIKGHYVIFDNPFQISANENEKKDHSGNKGTTLFNINKENKNNENKGKEKTNEIVQARTPYNKNIEDLIDSSKRKKRKIKITEHHKFLNQTQNFFRYEREKKNFYLPNLLMNGDNKKK